jgi:hypothetical protein
MIKVASCETTNLYRNFKDRNMANNTDALYKPLKTAKNDLLKVIDELDALGDLAVSFGGDIARVLPSQLKASTDAIMGLISGPNQNSIDSLTEYLDNVPLGAIKSHTAEDRLSGDSGTAPAPTPQIDTTPHTENGPQTAVHEDIDLSQFYKQNFVQPVKEKSFTEPDWNRIKESSDFTDIDLGEKMNPDYNPYDLGDPLQESANDPMNDATRPLNDTSRIPLNENSTWHDALKVVNPADFMEAGDFGGMAGPVSNGLNIVDQTL